MKIIDNLNGVYTKRMSWPRAGRATLSETVEINVSFTGLRLFYSTASMFTYFSFLFDLDKDSTLLRANLTSQYSHHTYNDNLNT